MQARPWQKLLLLLSGVMIYACLSLAQAQEATGTVTGVVLEPHGPVVGAKVVLMSSVLSSYEGVGFTDEQGGFSLSGVPAGGEVQIRVYNEADQVIGEGSGSLNFAGETIVVDIAVEP